MSVFVKICGICDEAGLDAAVEAGADAVGFVFHAPSPRNVTPALAASLAVRLPHSMVRVAVTLHPDQRLVEEVLAALRRGHSPKGAGDPSAQCIRVEMVPYCVEKLDFVEAQRTEIVGPSCGPRPLLSRWDAESPFRFVVMEPCKKGSHVPLLLPG